ncbi:MAG: dockerin type I repeat-containing protein [Ruminococcus sp.]|nr:dockerin type I repeat-containing protein [Ruminococcus sp.]
MPVSPQTDLTQFSYVTVSNCKSITELEVSNARRMSVKDMPALETLKLTASPHATSDEEYYNIDYASCPKLKDIFLYNADVQPTPKEAALMAENGITIHCPAADGWGTYLGHYNVNYTFIDAEALQGDANCDGNVDMADAVLIMQSIANPSKYKLTDQGRKNADTDGDGITTSDALAIQKKLLGLDTEDVPDIDPSLLANSLFYTETEDELFHSISFGDNGKFYYHFGIYTSSAQDQGTWTISGDTVILTGQYGTTNRFRYKDDTLICITENSEGFGYDKRIISEKFIKVKENS